MTYFYEYIYNDIYEYIHTNTTIPRHFCYIFDKKTLVVRSPCCEMTTYYYGNQIMSLHAEMRAVKFMCENKRTSNQIIKNFNKIPKVSTYNTTHNLKTSPITNKYKKYKVFVIRVLMNVNNTFNFDMSKPCLHCSNLLCVFGFNKIYYTNENSQFIKLDILNDTYKFSSGFYLVNKDIVFNNKTTSNNNKLKKEKSLPTPTK